VCHMDCYVYCAAGTEAIMGKPGSGGDGRQLERLQMFGGLFGDDPLVIGMRVGTRFVGTER